MEGKSPFQRIRELEAQLQSIASYIDLDALPAVQRELVLRIKRQITDARLDVRDYGMADAKAEQDRLAENARKRLEQLQKHILQASEYNLFGAADVAQLSANIQQIITDL